MAVTVRAEARRKQRTIRNSSISESFTCRMGEARGRVSTGRAAWFRGRGSLDRGGEHTGGQVDCIMKTCVLRTFSPSWMLHSPSLKRPIDACGPHSCQIPHRGIARILTQIPDTPAPAPPWVSARARATGAHLSERDPQLLGNLLRQLRVRAAGSISSAPSNPQPYTVQSHWGCMLTALPRMSSVEMLQRTRDPWQRCAGSGLRRGEGAHLPEKSLYDRVFAELMSAFSASAAPVAMVPSFSAENTLGRGIFRVSTRPA